MGKGPDSGRSSLGVLWRGDGTWGALVHLDDLGDDGPASRKACLPEFSPSAPPCWQ